MKVHPTKLRYFDNIGRKLMLTSITGIYVVISSQYACAGWKGKTISVRGFETYQGTNVFYNFLLYLGETHIYDYTSGQAGDVYPYGRSIIIGGFPQTANLRGNTFQIRIQRPDPITYTYNLHGNSCSLTVRIASAGAIANTLEYCRVTEGRLER